MTEKQTDIPEVKDSSDESKEELRDSLNNRISYLCRLAALIIAVVIFATTILGQDNAGFVILGLSLSVALLAIAGLQQHSKPKR